VSAMIAGPEAACVAAAALQPRGFSATCRLGRAMARWAPAGSPPPPPPAAACPPQLAPSLPEPRQSAVQYDTDVTTWSPQGRIFQIEYAMEAVKQGSAAVGLKVRFCFCSAGGCCGGFHHDLPCTCCCDSSL